jgi:hypothetical protein
MLRILQYLRMRLPLWHHFTGCRSSVEAPSGSLIRVRRRRPTQTRAEMARHQGLQGEP